MEVVKAGRPQKGWSNEFVCTGKGSGEGGCGAVLLVSQYDVYRKIVGYDGYYDDEPMHGNFFICSQCGVETKIELPEGIRPRGSRPKHKKPKLLLTISQAEILREWLKGRVEDIEQELEDFGTLRPLLPLVKSEKVRSSKI